MEILAKFESHPDNWLFKAIFTLDGSKIISIGPCSKIEIHDIFSQVRIAVLTGHDTFVHGMAISKDGSKLISGDCNGIIKIWDLQTYQLIATVNNADCVEAIIVSPDTTSFATCHDNGKIKIWDIQTYKQKDLLKIDTNPINDMDFSSDGKYIVAAIFNKRSKIWSVDNRNRITKLSYSPDTVKYNPNGTQIALSSEDYNVAIVNAQGRKDIAILPHTKRVMSIAFSSDGKLMATGGEYEYIKVWNTQNWSLVCELNIAEDDEVESVHTIEFSPDDSMIVFANRNTIFVYTTPQLELSGSRTKSALEKKS